MLLLIHNILDAIQYTQTILDFIVFAQYTMYDKEMLYYMEQVLYKLEKTK